MGIKNRAFYRLCSVLLALTTLTVEGAIFSRKTSKPSKQINQQNKQYRGIKEVTIHAFTAPLLTISFKELTAGACVKLNLIGTWPDHGDVFFEGSYYLSSGPGTSVALIPDKIHFGNYVGSDTLVRTINSPNIKTEAIAFSLFDGGSGFDGPIDTFTGTLFYEVVGDQIESVR